MWTGGGKEQALESGMLPFDRDPQEWRETLPLRDSHPHPDSPVSQVEKAATVPRPKTSMNKGFLFSSSKEQMILPPSSKTAPTWRSAFLTYVPSLLSVLCFLSYVVKSEGGPELPSQGTLPVSGRNMVFSLCLRKKIALASPPLLIRTPALTD